MLKVMLKLFRVNSCFDCGKIFSNVFGNGFVVSCVYFCLFLWVEGLDKVDKDNGWVMWKI